jgi:hypothetical protein
MLEVAGPRPEREPAERMNRALAAAHIASFTHRRGLQ